MNKGSLTHIPVPAEIIALEALTPDTKLIRVQFKSDKIARSFRFFPGQFVQVSAIGAGEAPFSPVNGPQNDGLLDLCIRKAGHVTSRLHSLNAGETVHIRGPFGNGFPLSRMVGHDVLLLAGGLGIVPLHSLLCYLVAQRKQYGAITFMYGARDPSSLLFRRELQEMSCRSDFKLKLTVDFAGEDDAGQQQCNVGLLPSLLQNATVTADSSYAAVCGPPALYRCIIAELQTLGFSDDRVLLSLERRMKCGLGRCAHCAIGQALCCIDGPVFSYNMLKEIEGAI